MRNLLRWNRSFPDKLAVFFLFLGIAAGTVWVNLEKPEQMVSVPLLASVFFSGTGGVPFLSLLLKRLCWLGLLWLLGLSKLAFSGICLFFFWSGISLSLLVAGLTIQYGIVGLLLFCLLLFPQICFYFPVFVILSGWALKGNETLHISGMLVLALLTAAGAAAESYGNPRFLGWIFAHFF